MDSQTDQKSLRFDLPELDGQLLDLSEASNGTREFSGSIRVL